MEAQNEMKLGLTSSKKPFLLLLERDRAGEKLFPGYKLLIIEFFSTDVEMTSFHNLHSYFQRLPKVSK